MKVEDIKPLVDKCIKALSVDRQEQLQKYGGMFYLEEISGELHVNMQIGSPWDRAAHENISHLPNARYEADQGEGFDDELEEIILMPQSEFFQSLVQASEDIAINLIADWEYRLQQDF